MPRPRKTGIHDIGYAELAQVTGDTSKFSSNTNRHHYRGLVDLLDRESLVRYCIWYGRPEFRKSVLGALAETRKKKADRDPAVFNGVTFLENMVLQQIYKSTRDAVDTYFRVYEKQDPDLLVVTKDQKIRMRNAAEKNTH